MLHISISTDKTIDGFYQTTNNTSAFVHFRIIPTTNPTFSPGFELERKGANNRRMNQFFKTGVNRNISEWEANDHGNPVRFIEVKQKNIE